MRAQCASFLAVAVGPRISHAFCSHVNTSWSVLYLLIDSTYLVIAREALLRV
jgi:hypothetical protein